MVLTQKQAAHSYVLQNIDVYKYLHMEHGSHQQLGSGHSGIFEEFPAVVGESLPAFSVGLLGICRNKMYLSSSFT